MAAHSITTAYLYGRFTIILATWITLDCHKTSIRFITNYFGFIKTPIFGHVLITVAVRTKGSTYLD